MEKFKGGFYLAIGFIFAGTSVIAARFVTAFLGPFTITAVSLLIALVLLLPFYYFQIKVAIKQMSKNDWLMIGLQAFFGIFLFRAFLLFGLQRISSTEAGVLIGTAPILTSILAYTLLKEKATLKTITGILCAVLGIIFLQGAHFSNFTLGQSIGTILVLGAAAAFSGLMPFTSMILSHWILDESIAPLQWLGGGMVILGVILIGISQSQENKETLFQT
ncbi:DMT family transporter [Fusibacter sp. 3D3]|uniref:DMT family transporter n=1 Tax=Fusibacter sp. 3D3 TaxID=1048380 RepID=UPI0008535EE7|nr:DMT family transporter [Fusibacter sp. 3D3]GAU76693.1 permease of the drug-metabolite transporter [Fusibacter sp. 3D3]